MKYSNSVLNADAQTKNDAPVMSRFLVAICIGFLSLMLASCGGDGNTAGPDPDPDPDPNPDRNMSFSEDISPIFQTSCAVGGCHDSGSQTSGVNLSSYDDAMNSVGNQYQQNVINAGNPDDSPLVDKIESNPQIGQRMPLQRDPLSQADIDSIRAWITDDAPDN